MEPSARAVGEIGLDYHYDFAPRDVQQQVFREQIRMARRRGLPIVIHTREAEDDTFRILAEEPSGEGVFHCFTGDRAMARRALDIGFHVSLAGIVSFPKALELKEVAKMVPLERLLIETISRAGAAPRAAQRAVVRDARGRSHRRTARRRAGSDRRSGPRQFRAPVQAVSPTR
jgi:TatD family hydrolase